MIIGITGTIGAGKGTVTEYLVTEKKFERFAVSDTFLAGEARRRGLEPTRQARHDIANEFRAKGPTELMEALYKMALPAIMAGKNVIIEPQHTVAEVEFIQSKGGVVLGVDADIRVRYERIRQRGSEKDKVTFEEFAYFDELEAASDDPNRNNLRASSAAADVHLKNNGSLEELHVAIEEVLAKVARKS